MRFRLSKLCFLSFLEVVILVVMTVFSNSDTAAAMTFRQAVESLLGKLGQIDAPADTLFKEDFESGKLDSWRADRGWSVTDRPDKLGKCALVVSSDEEHEDLVLKERIPIVPGHPIAVFWRSRFVSGADPLYLRVDFFDENGKQGQPYARQEQFRQDKEWTENALLVSDWFPGYTRYITIHFHHTPKARTSSMLDDIRVVDLERSAQALITIFHHTPKARTSSILDDIRNVVDLQRYAEALIKQQVEMYIEMANRLAKEVSTLPKSPVNDGWKRLIANRLGSVREELIACSKMEVGSKAFQKKFERTAIYVKRFSEVVTALRQRKVKTSRVLVYRTKPISSNMILPSTTDLPGKVAREVELTACPGEYESASLVLWSPERVSSLFLSASDLKGVKSVIPSANVDIKYVKCWFQGGNAPYGITVERNRKALIAELLLNDDSLVKVDYENQRNYLKLSFPEGTKYVPIDDPTIVPWGSRYTLAEFPVQDSPVLLPFDLASGENKQVWVTVKVPSAAKPGRYTGRITLSAEGKEIGHVALIVQVLPFALDAPKTHYDLKEPFTYSLYYWGELDPEGAGSIGYKYKSEKQFRAELRYMFEHGIVAPAMIWSPEMVYQNERLFRKHLSIMREIGMSGRPLYFADSGMVGNPTEPDALEELRRKVRQTLQIAREYGFPQVYFYGIDEATGDLLKSQRPAWQAVHEAGGKIFVSGFAGQLEAVGDLLDLFNRAGNPEAEQPAEWHKRGHKVWNYANPQTPVEDPEIYRRNYGLYLWRLDYDGACTYCFMDSEGRTWNDFDGRSYRDHAVAYPTTNGVVGTLALEGFREGVDDVKYATVLRREIEKAITSGTPKAKDSAAKALKWLDSLNLKQADLDDVRQMMVRYILELRHQLEY